MRIMVIQQQCETVSSTQTHSATPAVLFIHSAAINRRLITTWVALVSAAIKWRSRHLAKQILVHLHSADGDELYMPDTGWSGTRTCSNIHPVEPEWACFDSLIVAA